MLTFLTDPDERHLPMGQRTKVWVCDEGKRIATLSAVDDESASRNSDVAIWNARIHHKQFDPFMHDHEHDEEQNNVHVTSSEDGMLSLNNPKHLSLSDARQWVRDNYTGGKRG